MVELTYKCNGDYNGFNRLGRSAQGILKNTACLVTVMPHHLNGESKEVGIMLSEYEGGLEAALRMVIREVGVPAGVSTDSCNGRETVERVLCEEGYTLKASPLGGILGFLLGDTRKVEPAGR